MRDSQGISIDYITEDGLKVYWEWEYEFDDDICMSFVNNAVMQGPDGEMWDLSAFCRNSSCELLSIVVPEIEQIEMDHEGPSKAEYYADAYDEGER